MACGQEDQEVNPQYLDIPKPTPEMVVWSVAGVSVLLLIAVAMGVLAKKKWGSFQEYLVGKRDSFVLELGQIQPPVLAFQLGVYLIGEKQESSAVFGDLIQGGLLAGGEG
jgi:hypothetical protein